MTSRLDELKTIFLLCDIFIMCTWDFCFIKPCQCLYHLVDNSIIFSGKITCNVKICREKNVKLTHWRHPYFSHFCWMVWGAGKFVVKTARVYRVNHFRILSTCNRWTRAWKYLWCSDCRYWIHSEGLYTLLNAPMNGFFISIFCRSA